MVVEQNDSNIVIVSVHILHMWQCHVSQMIDTEKNNGVSEERASLVFKISFFFLSFFGLEDPSQSLD